MARPQDTVKATPVADASPLKRLRLTLTLDAHDLAELSHDLRLIAIDLGRDGREKRRTTSAGTTTT